jgi:type IV pilus assembly protein PilM
VDDHIAILHAAGLEPAIIDIDVFAIGNAFTCARGLERAPEEPPKVRALVDIGASKTSINVLRGSVSQFAREVYVAGNDLLTDLARGLNNAPEEAERAFITPGDKVDQILDIISPVLEDLGQEIRLSFEFYKEQFDKSVEEVYLSGGSSQLPKLDKFLERIFDVTTNRWDPTENLSFAMDSVAVDKVKQDSPRLAVAVGLASRALTSQQL